MKRDIYVYRDEGVCPFSYKHTVKALKHALNSEPFSHLDLEIKKITQKQVIEEDEWSSLAALFVMPGGRDLPYLEKLRGEGNRKIGRYVQEGGAYFGICAGAYYGSGRVVFGEGLSFEVMGDRELCFFPGDAVGPLYDPLAFSYENEKGERSSDISFGSETFTVYYKGGCYFRLKGKFPSHIKVIGRFKDLDENDHPAIVHCQVGKGKALLSGVHVEINLDEYLGKEKAFESINDESEGRRKKLFSNLLEQIIS